MKETPLPLIVFATSSFGTSAPARSPANARAQLVVIVTVARRDLPAERTQLRLEIAEREDLVCRLVGLQLVAVDDHPEVALRVRRRSLQTLEVLAFLQLSVAGHHDDVAAAA